MELLTVYFGAAHLLAADYLVLYLISMRVWKLPLREGETSECSTENLTLETENHSRYLSLRPSYVLHSIIYQILAYIFFFYFAETMNFKHQLFQFVSF